MKYAQISIDRRAEYYERAASLIAADPLGFYARAEKGRQVQAAIKPKDLQPFSPASAAPAQEERVAEVLPFSNARKRATRR